MKQQYKTVMVTKRQKETYDDDIDRLAERIWTRGRGKIKNKADFLSVYNGYMRDTGQLRNKELQEKVFDSIRGTHDVSSAITTKKERVKVFREAGTKPSPAEFDTAGSVGGKIVKVRLTHYHHKKFNRQVWVYRDKKGRFAKVVKTQ